MLREEMRRESVADGATNRLPSGQTFDAPSTDAGHVPAECAKPLTPQGHGFVAHSTHAGVEPADGAKDEMPSGHIQPAPSTIAGAEPAGEANPAPSQDQVRPASPSHPAAKRARRAKIAQAPIPTEPDATVAADKAAECAKVQKPNGQASSAHSTTAGASRRGKAKGHATPAGAMLSSTDAAGDGRGDDHGNAVTHVPTVVTEHTRGQGRTADHLAGAAREGGEGQFMADLQTGTANPALIHLIRSLHREHRGIQRAVGDWSRRIKAEERWFAVVRIRATGEELPDSKFPKTTPADEAAVIATRARYCAARDFTEQQRKACQKELLKAAKQLPAAAWVQSVRGFGMPSFAAVVGEAGDLGSYDSVAKLWKRMGLAVIDGKAQRRVSDAAEAARHGYNPRRRSEMHVVGECILKAGGPYREVYDQRKAYEAERDPAMSKIHAHRRAMRYVEKRLLRDLWRAWRQATVAADATRPMPAADFEDAAA